MSVQLPPSAKEAKDAADDRPLREQEYLDKYFAEQRISICWMTARAFSKELRRRGAAR